MFDAVMSCDRDRQRLMKLVELEVEERLKLRRQSEVEEVEKMVQKDGRLSRPERISTPVEPDSTVACDSVHDKHSSDNEVDSSENETSIAQHVDSSMEDGEVVSDSSVKIHGPNGKRTRKRKHIGEDYSTKMEVIGKTGRSDAGNEYGSIIVANICTASGQTRSNTNCGTRDIMPGSGLGVPVVCAGNAPYPAKHSTGNQSIKYRPWVDFEVNNPSEVQTTNTRSYPEEEPRMAYPWQNHPSGNAMNSKQQMDAEQLAKRHKNRPQPIEIPPDKGTSGVSYPSWLRSPCLRGDASVLPYTPPPMLSPTRNGAGLFWTVNQVAPTPAVKQTGLNTSSQSGWLFVRTPYDELLLSLLYFLSRIYIDES